MTKAFRLKLSNLQYFADVASDGGSTSGESASGEQVNQMATSTQNEHMIPKTRFDEVNEKVKELSAQLEGLQNQKAKDEKTKAEKLGEFEQLYRTAEGQVANLTTKHKSASERVTTLEGIISGMLETKMSVIPEDFHELIPTEMSLEQKLAWIDKAQTKGMFRTKEDVVIGEATNRKIEPKVDVKQMSPIEKILASYSKQK
ncbi:hypothetical protein COK07_29275 [Bacillus thuringiensis]|uniref:hypothetical protein n=1 Tax=Bacillus thuringiensis TaxID=1428 RepID=UPI000BECAB6A|nr:hypothetical protein [Bacillus thuringiensis]PEF03526.1 hypothetical protein COM97_26320 [Bacillus thuringiensis]PFI26679.1 hypothetical protein COI53_26760 [Bacillus thuringiensis]PFP70046.1 hypothetical protein COK07_29275 [Bacillus thuringiensis]